MTFERGTRVVFTDRQETCHDGACAYTGQMGTSGPADRHGVVVTFADGFATYAFNDEIEAAS